MIRFDHAALTEVKVEKKVSPPPSLVYDVNPPPFFSATFVPTLPSLFLPPSLPPSHHSHSLASPLKLVPALHLQHYPQVSGVGVGQNVK